ncbi:hypothetical protein KC19_VG257500 [Ceratodon purpureus]|uniref:CUE domain-containing protein n=1 Tax=Ceratodon purpureus TaxID=3225 RepID=A0A8T0HUF2_CERPU|nr:hypothetical protein KC19_VG257500 [Ceratodon purpureus]
MSAVVCGKRSLFEDLHSSPPISKRLRFTQGNSPIRFASAGIRSGPNFDPRLEAGSLLAQLHALFPDMEEQAVAKVLEASNDDLDYAIKSLNLLRLSSSQQQACAVNADQQRTSDPFLARADQQQAEATSSPVQSEGSKWVELLVSEMTSATDMNSARARASCTLEAFERAVMSRSSAAIEEFQKENVALKEQNRGLMHDNQILKRAVAIQHERQQDHESRGMELQQVKQLLAQYQEQVRTLELSNYSLTIHLRQAEEGSSMPGRFHPDVF